MGVLAVSKAIPLRSDTVAYINWVIFIINMPFVTLFLHSQQQTAKHKTCLGKLRTLNEKNVNKWCKRLFWKLQGVCKLRLDYQYKDITMTLPWWGIFRNNGPVVRIPSVAGPKPQTWLNRALNRNAYRIAAFSFSLSFFCFFLSLSLLFLSLSLPLPSPPSLLSIDGC